MNLIAILTNGNEIKLEKVARFIFYAENKELLYQFEGDHILKTMDDVKTLESVEIS